MKKILVIMAAAFCTIFSAAAMDDFSFGVWYDLPGSISSRKIDGVALGLPVVANARTEGASLALCGNHTQNMDGFQFALLGYNNAVNFEGVQLALVNIFRNQRDEFAMQWGFYNQAGENGIQLGVFNHAKNNASFQLGLININKNGLLPVMIFVNFGKDLFDF